MQGLFIYGLIVLGFNILWIARSFDTWKDMWLPNSYDGFYEVWFLWVIYNVSGYVAISYVLYEVLR